MDNIDYFKNKTILITGGSGSIGSQILKSLLKTECRSIRILSNNEHELFLIQQEYGNNPKIRILLGDIRDKDRMLIATKNVDLVFHAAALKHLPICEYNPFDAVRTNVIGTQNIIEAAIESEVEKFVFISTDKATNPSSTLGATKLLAERLTISSLAYQKNKKTILYSVRFGNVLSSRGSVFEIFYEQIKNGQNITLTSKEMTRFTMTPHDAVELILSTVNIAKGGEIFVLKMPVMKVIDLAKAMIEEYGNGKQIKIFETGIRDNEKLHEELISKEEISRVRQIDNIYVIPPNFMKDYHDFPKIESVYSSDLVEPMKIDEIRKIINEL